MPASVASFPYIRWLRVPPQRTSCRPRVTCYGSFWKMPDPRRSVVGNSAGAGLGLAAVQWLRDSGYRQPNGLVLISPGVDGSIDRPEHLAVAARDPLQDIPGIIEAGRLYAGDLNVDHPYVSPLNG